jgi:hypothetical protein
MRKVLIPFAALVLCAGPALAQQQSQDLARAPSIAAAAPAPAPQADAPQPQKPAPSLHVSTDEIRRQVQAAEEKRSAEAQVGSHNFLYVVAAVVLGVIIAALILD